MVVPAVVVLVLPWGGPLFRGVIAGALLASWGWMIYVAGLLRTYPATVGEWGESFTRELLASKDLGWPSVHDVPMRHRNVDHVAVSPRAVLAIETKFVGAGRHWETDARRSATLASAVRSAKSVRSLLRSAGITDVPVEPVLVLWGPGAPHLQHGWSVDGDVAVVHGPAHEEWCSAYSRGPITPAQSQAIISTIRDFQRMRDEYTESQRRSS